MTIEMAADAASVVVDARGMRCPWPALRLARAMREARDRTLAMPKLILPSVQVNMRGGRLPEPESNGTRYLKLPLDIL